MVERRWNCASRLFVQDAMPMIISRRAQASFSRPHCSAVHEEALSLEEGGHARGW